MIYTVSNGSGGSPNVLIKTETGATVTLSKGDVVLTKVAENGEALFENVEYGTWTAVATLGDKSTSIQVVVNETIEEEINMGLMLSSLPLKTTKLKIGGIKWILFARDHEGYPSGAQTLVSEYILENSIFNVATGNYVSSKVRELCQTKYEAFADYEKAYVLETTRKVKNTSGEYPEITDNLYILTSTEVGGNTDQEMVSNIGFTGNADRICTIENGAAQYWWLADAASSDRVMNVILDGSVNGIGPGVLNGVRPAMNLSANTRLNETPDSEGYYTIYREVETASDLIVGDKVKIGGTKYIVKAKNHAGYPEGAVTLISEYLVSQSNFGVTTNYAESTVKSLCEQYYNELSQAEKDAIALTTRKVKNSAGAYPEFNEHIFIMNSTEVGGTSDAQMGSNIGFTDNASRIASVENGSPNHWWLADPHSQNMYIVFDSGGIGNDSVTKNFGVRPALNLSPTAPIAPMDSTGYYSIQGADTISTLKDKSLNILGVEL